MTSALVDTSVLVGMADSSDQHHDTSRDIVRGMDSGELPTGVVTNYVALETLNWVHARKRHQKATEIYDRLHRSAGFGLRQAAQKDFTMAGDLFERYEGLSFGDATIVSYMRRTGIEHLYSFDTDFDTIDGITRIATARGHGQ